MDKNITVKAPLVTVFMAVYNGEKYIAQAIDSVLKQSLTDFELLIINDGSTDNSVAIIESYIDSRIRLLHNEKNLGLFFTRTRSIQEATGKYFAIQDCDDIAFENRLQYQVDFLEQNNSYALCGSMALAINHEGETTAKLPVVTGISEILKTLLLFSNIFINSTVMFRSEVLKKYSYNPGFEPAEDYDLTERMVSDNFKVKNLSTVLIKYRIHGQNVSLLKNEQRLIGEGKILRRQLLRLIPDLSDTDLGIHHQLLDVNNLNREIPLKTYEKWLLKIRDGNLINKIYDQDVLSEVLLMQLYKIAPGYGVAKGYLKLFTSKLLRLNHWKIVCRFIIKKLK